MPRKADYPIDVWRSDECAYSKGHHDIYAFAMAVIETTADVVKPDTFRRRYARAVPVPGEQDMGLVFCAGPGRGAFPITEAEIIR